MSLKVIVLIDVSSMIAYSYLSIHFVVENILRFDPHIFYMKKLCVGVGMKVKPKSLVKFQPLEINGKTNVQKSLMNLYLILLKAKERIFKNTFSLTNCKVVYMIHPSPVLAYFLVSVSISYAFVCSLNCAYTT